VTGRIALSRPEIDAAIARCATPVVQYAWLQDRFSQPKVDVRRDALFQQRFATFYNFRGRNAAWRSSFFCYWSNKRRGKQGLRTYSRRCLMKQRPLKRPSPASSLQL